MHSNYTPSASDTMSDNNSDVMVGEEGSVDWVPWVAAVFGVAAVIGVLFILRCEHMKCMILCILI